MTDLESGRQLGVYRIERLLGSGGMGRVFLAFDTTLHRHVALKVIDAVQDHDAGRTRLLHEARNAAALNHPNICTIHEVGDADGAAFIAMEYVDGRSLRDRLDQGPLPIDQAVRYGIQAASALAYAHDHGVVHRDFKAANVIVTSADSLKIVDFGLARRDDALMTAATTMMSLVPAGATAGTPYAMAPEQVRGEAVDARADIWALGVLLAEMTAGARPFDAKTTPELFSSVLRDPPSISGAPAGIRPVIERCLEKIPDRRYQHANEVRAALEAVFPGGASPVRTPTPVRAQWRRIWIAAACLGAATAVLLGLYVAGVPGRFSGEGLTIRQVKLAVLPLENRTGDPAQDDFGDGLTDEVFSSLNRLHSPRLSMIARDASRPFNGSSQPVQEIGRALSANAVLAGSLSRSGDHLRISAQLVQVSNARVLWHEEYERDVSDVFALERQISKDVSTVLGVPASEQDSRNPSETRKVNAEAYDFYLRGLSHALRQNESDIDQAIVLLERAATLDPTFLPTQAYLALTYGNKSATFKPNEPQWEEKGFAAAQKALTMDPTSAEAHFARAIMLWRPSHGFPSGDALRELRQALAAEPNFDEAWHQHGVILMHVGHLHAASREFQRALDLNPGNTLARFRFGPMHVYEQKFDDAIAALNRVPQEAFPAQWAFQRAWALISLERIDEAGRFVDEALANNALDQGGVLHAARAMVRATRGDRAGATADIAEAARIGKGFMHFHHTAYAIGAVYVALGDLAKAQEWIENAANDGFPNYAYFEADAQLVPLRATPGFQTFLSKLRLEWEHIPGEPE